MNRAVLTIALVVATLLSAGSAYGVNTLISTYVEPDGPPATNEPPSSASPMTKRPSKSRRTPTRALGIDQYLDGIMRRNLFDEDIIASWNPQDKKDSGEEAVTPLKVKLLGTLVAEPETFSSALIADEDDPFPRGYSIGDVLHDREVVKIEKNRVTLRSEDGTIEILEIEADAAPSRPASTRAKPSEDGDDVVQEVDDNKFQVSKDLFDKYINDLEGISRMGRALLHRGPDGEFDGYRLSAIRRNTLADQLGIKNGDIIHSVNGQPLDSVQSAMTAYNTMRSESNFCFEITRRGSPVELCYDVR